MANLPDPSENENCSSLHSFIVPAELEEPTMLLQISSAAQLSVCRNGTMLPIPIEYGQSYSKCLWIAGVKDKIFYGDAALYWKNPSTRLSQKDTWFYDLVECLGWSTDMRENRFQIRLNNQVKVVSLEFLLGLYFKHLKDIVQKKQAISLMRKLLIVIPLWFPNFHRQRLRHAGVIAGFNEVLLINEITAVPLFHLVSNGPNESQHESTPQSSSCKRSFLVINENSDNIDIATFEYYEDVDGRKVLEMIGLDGNMYEQEKTEKGIEKKINRIRYIREPLEGNRMSSLVNDLLQDASDKLKQSGRKVEDLEVILYCHNRIWLPIFLRSISLILGTSIKIHTNYLDSVIYGGKPYRYQSVIKIQSQIMPNRIVELNAFTFYRRDFEDAFIPCVLLKQGEKLPEDEVRVSLKIGIPSSTHVVVFQKNVTGAEPRIGDLKLSRFLYYLYQEVGTSFTVDKNGMLKFDHVFGVSSKGSIEVAPQKYFSWRSANLSCAEVKQCQLLLHKLGN